MRITNKPRPRPGSDDAASNVTLPSVVAGSCTAIAHKFLDTLLPPRCVTCGQEIDSGHGLCASCWGGLTFIDEPHCAQCGLPFDFEAPSSTLCGPCLASPPSFDRARAALVYDDSSRPLILGFKHGDRTDRAVVLARLMTRLLADLGKSHDFVLPVPLYRWRLWRRRYNQSALLAQRLGQRDRRYRPDILVRTRATPSQAGQNAQERRRNVRGAFGINPKTKHLLAGRRVLVVDDVMTTGATARECARTLKRAGVAEVSIAAVARAELPSRVD